MTLTKAKLSAIAWTKTGEVVDAKKPHTMEVQFNPASLKVSYSNQVQTNGNSNSSAIQYVGKGDSKLAVELIFDVSGAGASNGQDVRQMTKEIAFFMKTEAAGSVGQPAGSTGSTPAGSTPTTPAASTAASSPPASPPGGNGGQEQQRYSVPGLRFHWGTFIFDGILVSMDETLELWSEDGRPLRATVTLNVSQPGIHAPDLTNAQATPSPQGASQAGVTPLTPSPQGTTLQALVANASAKTDWKAVATLNGIENPRQLTPGTLLNLKLPR